MATCKNHPEIDARAVCSSCGAEVCEECLAPGEGEPVCFECSIKTAGREAAKQQVVDAQRPTAQKQRRLFPESRAFLMVTMLIIAGEIAFILLMIPRASEVRQSPNVDPRRRATAVSAADVILVSESVEAYHRERGEYPADLAAVEESLPVELRVLLTDPSTFYELDDQGGYRIVFKGRGPHLVTFSAEVRVPIVEGVKP